LRATIVPSNGAGTPPAHLPDSSRATGFLRARCVPGARIVTCCTRPAIVCDGSVRPIVQVPSAFGRTQT
jgi:hypothetical protein